MANLFGCDFSIGAEYRLPDPVAAAQSEPAEAGIRAVPAFDAAVDMTLRHQPLQRRHFKVLPLSTKAALGLMACAALVRILPELAIGTAWIGLHHAASAGL